MEPNKSSKVGWIIGVVVVVLILIGVVMISKNGGDDYAVEDGTPTPTPSVTATPADESNNVPLNSLKGFNMNLSKPLSVIEIENLLKKYGIIE